MSTPEYDPGTSVIRGGYADRYATGSLHLINNDLSNNEGFLCVLIS